MNLDRAKTGGPEVAAAFALGALPALLLTSPWLGEHDSVNFALALERFDLASAAPHFPGYPVYVWVARLVHGLGVTPPYALAIPGSLLLGCGAAALVAALRSRSHGPGLGEAQWLALLLATVTPLWVLTGARGLSDATGTGIVLLAFAAALARKPRAAGILVGLALGARLSLWPFAIALLLSTMVDRGHERARGHSPFRLVAWTVLATAAGIAAWLVPLAALVGPTELWSEAVRHAAGHFGRWGGTAIGAADPAARMVLFGASVKVGLLSNVSGLAVLGGILWVVGITIGVGRLRTSPVVRTTLLWLVPYAGWILVGQNPERPRHLLPLLPLAAVLAASGWEYLLSRAPIERVGSSLRLTAGFAAVIGLFATFPGAASNVMTKPPALRAARWIAAHYAPDEVLYYGGSETRLLTHYLPALRTKRLDTTAKIDADLAALGCPPGVDALVAAPVETPPPGFAEAARFEDVPAAAVSGDRSIVLYRRPVCARTEAAPATLASRGVW